MAGFQSRNLGFGFTTLPLLVTYVPGCTGVCAGLLGAAVVVTGNLTGNLRFVETGEEGTFVGSLPVCDGLGVSGITFSDVRIGF